MPRHHDELDPDDADDEGPGEHDAELLDEDEASELTEQDLARCPHCRKAVSAHATECHRCGASFGKEAWLVDHPARAGLWLLAVILLLMALLPFLWLIWI